MSKAELACVYASLILADDDIDITADKLNTLIKAANIKFVEPYLPSLFASALNGRNVKDLLMNVGTPAAGAPAPAAAGAAAGGGAAEPAATAAPEKEPEPESDESMGFDLFG